MNKKEIQRKEKIEIRVTTAEKLKYKQKAEDVRMNLSEYVREFLEEGQISIIKNTNSEEEKVPHYNEKKVLYGLANNLNQLVKISHQEKKIHPDIDDILVKIKQILIPHFY